MQWSLYDIFLDFESDTLVESAKISPYHNKISSIELDGKILTTDFILDGRCGLSYRMKLNAGKHILEIKAEGWFKIVGLAISLKKDEGIRQNIPLDIHLDNDIVRKVKDEADHIIIEFTTWE